MTIKRIQQSTIRRFIPPRNSKSRKGDNGTVLVVGGSSIYHGAPILSSLAALRCGTDLVYTAVPKINVQSARSVSPNLIIIPLVDQKLTRGAVNKLLGMVPKHCDSATIGMGLAIPDIHALKILVKSLVDQDVRLSLDASALVDDVLPLVAEKNTVVTPHAGEFKRLFGESPPHSIKERVKMVEDFANKNKVTILLKGPTDVISDGQTTYLNSKNVPAMTVGGTGDVLSGLVAGMLAKNRDSLQAASAAAYINGLAGYNVQKRMGLHMTSMDMIDVIPTVMRPFDKIVGGK